MSRRLIERDQHFRSLASPSRRAGFIPRFPLVTRETPRGHVRFHCVGDALGWYSRNHDGLRATWPDPDRAFNPQGPGRDVHGAPLVRFAIERALQALPAHHQRILTLYYLGERPVIDIAAELHRHPSRVYAQLSRARIALTRLLHREDLLIDQER